MYALAALALTLPMGCAVPQPRGDGQQRRLIEPKSQRKYWLYLPKDYVAADDAERAARRWPLVVTFHGMRPFDNATSQAHEWEREADRYGFIVVSPELASMDVLAEFPIRTKHPWFKLDEHTVLDILDQVFTNTAADRNNVLATGFSSGGYMAHYMVNQHPDVFTALAARQANYSAPLMDDALAPRSRYHPVLVLITENDFAICKRESQQAIRWYQSHGFQNFAWVFIKGLGHERTPELAADFFGRVAKVSPSTPSQTLVRRQAIDGNAEGLAFLSGRMPTVRQPQTSPTPQHASAPAGGRVQPPSRRTTPPSRVSTPPRSVSIRVSSAIGIEPLHLGFWAVCPSDWYETASFLWTLDGDPIATSVNGQRTLTTAGEHALGLLVVTSDNREFRATQRIRVLPHVQNTGYVGDTR